MNCNFVSMFKINRSDKAVCVRPSIDTDNTMLFQWIGPQLPLPQPTHFLEFCLFVFFLHSIRLFINFKSLIWIRKTFRYFDSFNCTYPSTHFVYCKLYVINVHMIGSNLHSISDWSACISFRTFVWFLGCWPDKQKKKKKKI